MSAHTSERWFPAVDEHGVLIRAESGDNIARVCEFGPQSETPDAQQKNATMLAAGPILADALFGLLVAIAQHTPNMTLAQLADISPACDAAAEALIASGRVLG